MWVWDVVFCFENNNLHMHENKAVREWFVPMKYEFKNLGIT
jgi:hypothetical protein